MSSNHKISNKVSRRDFLKITAITGLALGLGASIEQLARQKQVVKVAETHLLMGTIVNLSVFSKNHASGREAIRKTVAEMTRLIAYFDHRNTSSLLSQLNHTGHIATAPDELKTLICKSQELGDLSGGAFDITVKPLIDAYQQGISDISAPIRLVDFRKIHTDGDEIMLSQPGMSITLDGIAKGCVVDGGVAVLHSLGFDNVLVEAGGDMMASSSEIDGEAWKIGIRHPRNQSSMLFSFSVQNKAVATSGDYLNYFTPDLSSYHIIDPRVGKSPSELCSATVIASAATEADALSTTLMVLGIQTGMDLIQKIPGAEALLIDKKLRIYPSDGFPINL